MSELFDRPLGDWSDDELRVGIRVVCVRRDEVAADGYAGTADWLNELLCLLVDERAQRAVLYREMRRALSSATPDSLAALDGDGWLPDE